MSPRRRLPPLGVILALGVVGLVVGDVVAAGLAAWRWVRA